MNGTWMWDVESSLGDSLGERKERFTDIFQRESRPAPDTVLLGLSRPDANRERAIVAAGFAGRSQKVATGKDRVSISSAVYPEPIPLAAVMEALPKRYRAPLERALSEVAPLQATRLTPALGEHTLAAARELSAALAAMLDEREAQRAPVPGRRGARMREERDAITLAVEMSGLDLAPTELIRRTPDTRPALGFAAFLDEATEDNEDDLISADVRRFDPNGQLTEYTASKARFTDGRGFALTIINVNRRPIEKTLGVDLVYWDETHDVFTLIQYKRLTKREPAAAATAALPWAYAKRADIKKALALMDVGLHVAQAADWRMTTSPFWFKFVRTDAFQPNELAVLKGMYVPADFLRLALDDGSLQTGPQAGFQITYANTAYISRGPFIDLVRRGLVGTAGSQTSRVRDIIFDLAEKREVIVALKTAAEPERYERDDVDERTLAEILDEL